MLTIGRVKRLKQAKDEAVVEIENFKNEKERQHKILEQEVFILKLSKTLNNLIKNKQLNQILGSRSTNTDSIKQKTDQTIAEMTLAFNRNSKSVLEYILTSVKNVEATPHENQRQINLSNMKCIFFSLIFE